MYQRSNTALSIKQKPMRNLLLYPLLFSLFIFFSGFGPKNQTPYKNGDLVFIVNPSGQGKAIQLATRSRFTHVGIIFIEDGKAMVYHAVEPVSKNTLAEFIGMSADGHYEIKRLKDQALLTPSVIKSMLSEARSKLGIHYDLFFNWDDTELYCSEFVWKLYDHSLHLAIGKLEPLKSFDLSNPIVKSKLEQRYGKNIPYDSNMISPGDMYNSALLE